MSIKKILSFQHKVMRRQMFYVDTKAAKHELKVVRKIIDDLMHTATHHYSICLGLSANQLGYNARIFVMRQEGGPFFHVINPIIVAEMGGVKALEERCLSRVDAEGNLLPGIRKRRAKNIRVECFTFHWAGYNTPRGHFVKGPCFRKEIFELNGIDARVFQHELDHLNGVEI